MKSYVDIFVFFFELLILTHTSPRLGFKIFDIALLPFIINAQFLEIVNSLSNYLQLVEMKKRSKKFFKPIVPREGSQLIPPELVPISKAELE